MPAYSARGPSNRSVFMKQSHGPWNLGGMPAGPQPGPSAWRRTCEQKCWHQNMVQYMKREVVRVCYENNLNSIKRVVCER